jgi:hypothetical protein
VSLLALFDVNDAAELRARLRTLRLAARLLCGPRGTALERALHDAEHDAAALPRALALLDDLTPLDRRRVLTAWGRTL